MADGSSSEGGGILGGLMSPAFWLLAPYTIATWCFIIKVGDQSAWCIACAPIRCCMAMYDTVTCALPVGKFIDYAYLWFLFRNIDPYFWSALGVVFSIALSVLGAAWCVAPLSCLDHSDTAEHLILPFRPDSNVATRLPVCPGASSQQAAALSALPYEYHASRPRTSSGAPATS
jgi:hypothetical protein